MTKNYIIEKTVNSLKELRDCIRSIHKYMNENDLTQELFIHQAIASFSDLCKVYLSLNNNLDEFNKPPVDELLSVSDMAFDYWLNKHEDLTD